MRSKGCWGLISITVLVWCAPAVMAAEPRGRWFGGGSIAFRSTTDEIRSNAQITLGPLGDDGIPNTFDPNESNDCSDQASHCDIRPDYLLNSPTTIEETFQYNLHAGYMPFRWLSAQIDYSWFEADVGPVDAFLSDHFPIAANPSDPVTYFNFKDREVRLPLAGGKIRETTVALSLNYHFRTNSHLKPYVGAGAGKIYVDHTPTTEISDFNARVSRMRIRVMTDQFFKDATPKGYSDPLNDARIPLPEAVTVEVADTSEWHLNGGVEYQLTSRIGMTFDARYVFAPGGIRFDVGGHDQLDLTIWSEKIYRPDGSVRLWRPDDKAPNPLCFDHEYDGQGCDKIHMSPGDARVNPEAINPASGRPYVICPAVGDFDRDGRLDICYGHGINPSAKGFTEARGDVVIQGGEIEMSAFTVSVGMKVRF